jgi:hypothetical protein
MKDEKSEMDRERRLAIGSAMLNRREPLRRIRESKRRRLPAETYGIAISAVPPVSDGVIALFTT